jgi:N-acetyl-gamma-glutamyl-phosphate reductase
MKIPTGIIGASGYTGAELLRLIHLHPNLELKAATAESQAGKPVTELYPHLQAYSGVVLQSTAEAQEELNKCKLLFCGLPHGKAASILADLPNQLIVDLGSDFRLKNANDYDVWYSRPHPFPDKLKEWTYGLPEVFMQDIKQAKRIANPGCYATSVLLATAPLAAAGLVSGPIIVDAISGTSGAGKVPQPGLHFSHAFEDIRAYKIAAHQHTPEIEMVLSHCRGQELRISMTAHLAPMSRGIHATCSAEISKSTSTEELRTLFESFYENAPFVHIVAQPPGTKEVRGSNHAHLFPTFDSRNSRVVVTSVIDNLVKGAAGQAIHNANIALELGQTTGLEATGVYP